MTLLRSVRPRWAWEPGSSAPSYASTSVSRMVTPPWVKVAPSRRGAASRDRPAQYVEQLRSAALGHRSQPRWSATAARSSTSCSATRSEPCAAAAVARGDRTLDGEDLADRRCQPRVELGELLVGELVEVDAELLAAAYAGTGELVRATRNGTPSRTSHSATSVAREKPCGASSAVRSVSERGVATWPVKAGSEYLEGVDGVEDRLLVLLQVAVVGEREALERGQQTGEVADKATGLAAGELGDVGVLLLRHDADPVE